VSADMKKSSIPIYFSAPLFAFCRWQMALGIEVTKGVPFCRQTLNIGEKSSPKAILWYFA